MSRIDMALVVRPGDARKLLNCGNEGLYKKINSGVLESYLDGRARYITRRSIEQHIEQKVAESKATSSRVEVPVRRRRRAQNDPPSGEDAVARTHIRGPPHRSTAETAQTANQRNC